jgi:hypothetical protein
MKLKLGRKLSADSASPFSIEPFGFVPEGRGAGPREEAGMWEGKVKPIRALERSIDVLQVLQDSKAMELKDLNQATGLPRSEERRVGKEC